MVCTCVTHQYFCGRGSEVICFYGPHLFIRGLASEARPKGKAILDPPGRNTA
jgi:hypothetical protein